ncbi:MAG: hypothetical protein QOI38_2951 [Sphingomonadales bacterium]|jgi:hypothetical protein|nr:hypothetical protein [Sphingomonadales bacterium]
MRTAIAAAVAAVLAAPAAAQPRPGDRTRTPEQMVAEFGVGAGQDDLAEAIAAAAAHPLGTVQNPVRVGGPEGERAYLARLRCADGSEPAIGPRADAGIGAFGSVVASYPLDCGSAAPRRATVVMDMYHEEHRETRAPAGFAIVP